MNKEEKVYFTNSKGERLCGILSNPSGNKKRVIVIMAHGHSSNKNTKNFVRLKNILDYKNISSLRFDIRGHGESEGKFEETTTSDAVDDILQAIKYVKQKGYKNIGLLGSSFGGIASIIAASKTKDLIFLVLKSPVSDYKDLYLWRKTKIEDWKKKGYLDYSSNRMGKLKLNYVFYEDAVSYDIYKLARRIKIPTLIIHGDEDKEVPVYQSKKLARFIPNSRLVLINGADHTYSEEDHAQKMLKISATFIIKQTNLII